MDRMRCRMVAWWAWPLLLAIAATGIAGPRDAPQPDLADHPEYETPEPADWTKRLVGRFLFDGLIQHTESIYDSSDRDAPMTSTWNAGTLDPWTKPIVGEGDCIDFAEGPGLHCVLNVEWPEEFRKYGKDQMGAVPDLTPGMTLAGMTPSTMPGRIRLLTVNRRGLAHPGALQLKGNSASYNPPCVNQPGLQLCEQLFRITASADGKLLFVYLYTRIRYVRSKSERKPTLENDAHERTERATEGAEETLEVTFTLRRRPPLVQEPESAVLPVQDGKP